MLDTTFNSKTRSIYRLTPADFGRRFSAVFIDFILLTILVFLLKISFPDLGNALFFKKAVPFVTENSTNWILSKSSIIGIWIIYSIIMDCSTMQGTLGKQIMNVIVTDKNGNRLTMLKSVGRNLLKVVSFVFFGLGLLYIFFDKRKRCWHDVVANALVIQKVV